MNLIAKNDKVEILKDIVVPKKFYSRIDLGVPVLNEMFGGQDMPGILPGCSFLLTGTPGAGKSTMALQLADLMTRNSGKNVLYNLGEENRYMVKMRADRLRLSGSFCVTQISDVEDLMQFCDDTGVEVLIQDSLQSLRHGTLEGGKLLKVIAKKLQLWKERSDITIFLIGHSTKSGQFAGPNEIKHDMDAHAHLTLSETGNRILELQKNRFGPAAIPYEFSLSASGLDFKTMKTSQEPSDNEESSKSSERRDSVVSLIKDKLLSGEKVSGYCFERFNVECSGGFWRGMLVRACRELQNNGYKIGEVRVEGRMSNFVER